MSQKPAEAEPPSKQSKDIRKNAGTVLTVIGWGASGLSTILALSRGVSSVAGCLWPFSPASPFCSEFAIRVPWVTLELLVGTLVLGWALAGSGAVFLCRKLGLVLPVINLLAVMAVLPPAGPLSIELDFALRTHGLRAVLFY